MDIVSELHRAGAILQGKYFFVFKSGRVSDTYVNLDPVFTYPKLVDWFAQKLIDPYQWTAEVIAGPAIGGIPLIFCAAMHSELKSVRTVWADKKPDGTFEFGRMGFAEAVENRHVLVLEDITTTGSSAKAVCDLIKQAGGYVLSTSFIWNRGGVSADMLDIPAIDALVHDPIPSWQQGEHPQWGVWPVVADMGHPELAPDYQGGYIKMHS